MPAKTHTTALRHIHQAFTVLKHLPTPEPEELADLLGEIRHLETMMGDWRRSHLIETIEAVGAVYQTKTENECKRTYNLTRIIHDTGEAIEEGTFSDGYDELVVRGAIRVSAQWKKLKAAFNALDIPLTTVSHEIVDGDLDGPHVGEVWTSKTVNVPIGGK